MRHTVAILVVLLLASCSSSRQPQSSSSAVPSDFRVEFGEGGGFTGQWDGFEVDSAGGITRLSGRALGAVRTSAGQLSPEHLNALWSTIEASGILSAEETSQPGNMSRSISVTANGTTVSNTWPVSLPATSSLDSLYGAARSLVQIDVK